MYLRAYTSIEGKPKASLHLYCNTIKVYSSKGRKKPASIEAMSKQLHEKKIENISAITEPAEDLPF